MLASLAVRFVLAASATAFAIGPANATDGKVVRLSYDVYVGLFYVVAADAELRISADHYDVVTHARSKGLAALFFSWQSEARSEGRRANGRLLPRLHKVTGKWKGEGRRVRVTYDGPGRIEFEVVPPSDGAERDPVPRPLTVGTVDPLSATLSVLLRIAGGGNCDGEFPVFDGRRRYDMIMRAGASAKLSALHSSVFAGPAQRCDIKLRRIAGFWKKPSRFGRQTTDPVLWVARPFDGVPPVPVRFTAETGFGDLRIHLTRIQMGGRILALPESQGAESLGSNEESRD